jgi:hypothetical protein
MAGFSDYLENKIMDHIFGKATFTAPSNIYVALSTADPTDDASGLAEPSGGSYARKSTAPADWNAASGGAIDNANAITFAQATASWGTITHFALFDASSGGNMLTYGALGTSKAITTDDTPEFAAGDLDNSVN